MATAVDSSITDFGVSEGTAPAGLAWDGSTLYMVGNVLAARLYTVDRAAGVATAVDSNINTSSAYQRVVAQGLAWVPDNRVA